MQKQGSQVTSRPTDEDAKEAVATLIRWIGEDPNREGLINTPKKVVENCKNFFSGYNQDPSQILKGKFEKNSEFKDLIILKGIKFYSFCEHHILPVEGYVDVAYLPTSGIVGFNRVSRIVDAFASRLQLQERMTCQIAEALYANIKSEGVAVAVRAHHACMSLVGSKKESVEVYTEKMLGRFQTDNDLKNKFLTLISSK